MLTDFGYIGKVDGIEYATEAEAKEVNKDNTIRAARPPPFLYKFENTTKTEKRKDRK